MTCRLAATYDKAEIAPSGLSAADCRAIIQEGFRMVAEQRATLVRITAHGAARAAEVLQDDGASYGVSRTKGRYVLRDPDGRALSVTHHLGNVLDALARI